MAVLWQADCTDSTGNEWARGNAGDYQGGAPHDPSAYTGNRYAQETAALGVYFPNHTKHYRLTLQGTEEPQWTQSFGARVELGMHNGGSPPPGVDRLERQGNERWRAFWVNIPAGFRDGMAFCLIQQDKGAGSGSPMSSFTMADGDLRLMRTNSQTYGSTTTSPIWTTSGGVAHGKPLFLCHGVRWSTGSDGWHELHGDLNDGQGYRQLMARNTRWTLARDANGGAIVVGFELDIYRTPTAGTDTVRFAGMTMADTRADAETGAKLTTAPPVVTPPATPAQPTATVSGGRVTLTWPAT